MYDNSANGVCCLERKDFVKFLGILIDDCNLKWKHHIDFISLKISKTIGILARLRHFVPTETLLMIYRSFIMPYLSYGICVWGRAPKSYISKLLVLHLWGRGGLMVSALDSRASAPGSSPGRGHCVVFLGKTLHPHSASLHPGVPANLMLGVTLRWTSIPSRGE